MSALVPGFGVYSLCPVCSTFTSVSNPSALPAPMELSLLILSCREADWSTCHKKTRHMLKSLFLILPLSPPSSPQALIQALSEKEGAGFLIHTWHHHCSTWVPGEDSPVDTEEHMHPLPSPCGRDGFALAMQPPSASSPTSVCWAGECEQRETLSPKSQRFKGLPPHSKLCCLFIPLSRHSSRLNKPVGTGTRISPYLMLTVSKRWITK